jgi:hypothetical protein
MMTLPTGTKLGRYEIRSQIGEGGTFLLRNRENYEAQK